MTRQKEQRDAIIDAAMRVVYRDGYTKATIDGIAAEAGMSKGGVFYYFKNKKEIFASVLTRYEEIAEIRRQEIYDSLPEGPGRCLRASVLTQLEHFDKHKDNIHNVMGMYTEEDFRKALAALRRRNFKQLCQGCKCPEKLAMVSLVLDGLWMDRTMGEASIPASQMVKLRRELMRYIDEIAPECL
ncbi:MAG: TetR/AcrR family transcriptional regulator [Planctomycetaceae bacterium]|nr:TetR/AcrR family transcriptional regulator [Planctomycetaceae bacterium]